MEILFSGKHNSKELTEGLENILHLFKERYHIDRFHEIHLTLTLLDHEGYDVELIDTETSQVYRTLEVYPTERDLCLRNKCPPLHLVVDNTKHKDE